MQFFFYLRFKYPVLKTRNELGKKEIHLHKYITAFIKSAIHLKISSLSYVKTLKVFKNIFDYFAAIICKRKEISMHKYAQYEKKMK